jgi:crotonobetainyl-CoA:carnitine CoA-transferase CaiB-like acyl-CoA transferase
MGTLLDGVLADLGIADAADPEVTGPARPAALAAPLAVAECAVASVAACLVAAADLAHARTGRRPAVAVDTGHVAAAMRGEVLLRDPAGHGLNGFAPLSRLWSAADGWVRTHANYPWHRAALLAAFGVPDGPDDEVAAPLADAIAARAAREVEHTVDAAGGLAVAARTAAEWSVDEPGRAVAGAPLLATEALGTEALTTEALGRAALRRAEPGALPASGLRVLDLTRVIAGPVGTRMLGALGADVLRIDHPERPELPLHAVDGVVGKASAVLDATTEPGRDTLHALLAEADVLVTGYRPGALRRLGLDPDQVAERHPGTVVVTLSAWGTAGPWGGRRGFDSLVQVASGIGWATSADGERPGALPCQLLDHATGYLAAAGALAALARQARTGTTTHVRLSLARTAQWLLAQGPRADPHAPTDPEPYRVPLGDGWTGIAPPGRLDDAPLTWPHLPPRYGQARPTWAATHR